MRCALFANMIPRANPISAPRKAAMISILSEVALLVVASKKATYAMHRGHITSRRFVKTRRRFIGITSKVKSMSPIGRMNGKSVLRGFQILTMSVIRLEE